MPRKITDPYEVLGLDRNATQADVRRAYLRLVKRHHPDKNPGDKASEWIFKEIQSAYETLCDAKGVRAGRKQEPPPQGERAERHQPDATPRDRRQRQSERAERENHGRSRQSQSQAAREPQERARTTHTTSEGSRTQPKLLHRTIRWSKWAVYCSNALLWPVAMAGRLEGLPERAEWLVFYWIMLVGPCVLCWDFVLKDEIEQFRRKARKRR